MKKKTDNYIKEDGAHLLYDSLQMNSTMTSLHTDSNSIQIDEWSGSISTWTWTDDDENFNEPLTTLNLECDDFWNRNETKWETNK